MDQTTCRIGELDIDRTVQQVKSGLDDGADKGNVTPANTKGSTGSATPNQDNKGAKSAGQQVAVVNGIPVFHLGVLERGSKPK